jgi:ABC-2 type transport system permease protein
MARIAKLYSFLYLRGYKIWVSYKSSVVLTMLGWVLPVFTYYFVGTSLGEQFVHATGVVDYTSFFVIGLAFQGYVSNVIGSISQRIRNEQLYGTLEFYFLSPTGMFGLLVYSVLWGFVLNTVSVGATLAVGGGLGVQYTSAGIVGAAVIVTLLLISSFGLAMISAGTVIITKTGDPVSFFFTTFTALIAGAVFPITVFPYFLRLISYAVPLTWALQGLRDALLLGYGVSQLSGIIGILVVFDIITVPLGYFVFVTCFNYTKKKGSLLEY